MSEPAKWLDLVCSASSCGKSFRRRAIHHTHHGRYSQDGRHYKPYCSLDCRYRGDGLAVFRDFIRAATWAVQYRHRNMRKVKQEGTRMQMALTPEYLREIWESQQGLCTYTGIPLELLSERQRSRAPKTLNRASLDRIDPSKGYIPGNVEFVCLFINWGKNKFSKPEVIAFLKLITSNLSPRLS